MDRLEEAQSHREYEVLFCLIQKGEVDFYVVRETGIEDMSSIETNIPGKLYSDQESGESFYSQVQQYLHRAGPEFDYIVLAGPGHEKNKIKNKLSDEINENVFMQDTSVTGETGLNEAIKRGALEKVVEDSRISEETREFQKFTEKLREGEESAYGPEEVYESASQGAVEKLLITSEMNRERPEIAEKVEQMGGDSIVLHTDHEAGERLEELGGAGAILRY
jgi:Predicted RNA-binding proteins